MKILIIEDDIVQKTILRKVLEMNDYQVIEAINGEEAWQMIEKYSIRMVITDWMLPGLTGPDLIGRIRKHDFDHYIYTILLTSKDSQENVVMGLESGADDYLTKPFDNAELMARLSIGQRILDLESRLVFTASHDPLTKLLNRKAFYNQLQIEFRQGNLGDQISFIMFDIDYFKKINDTYGHLVGDQALTHISFILSESIIEYGVICRWGGEEFLAYLPDCQIDKALEVAKMIKQKIADQPIKDSSGNSIRLTISAGVSAIPIEQQFDVDSIIQKVDKALYQAKDTGRNRVCVLE